MDNKDREERCKKVVVVVVVVEEEEGILMLVMHAKKPIWRQGWLMARVGLCCYLCGVSWCSYLFTFVKSRMCCLLLSAGKEA